jgi:riboflavin kinase/FMN adenylyltransferase
MLVFRGVPEQADGASVLTIGNFDGVHRGHKALLERLTARARELGVPAAVLTFEPHPREFFAPDSAPARLSALREKLALLEGCGVDRVYVIRFNRRWAALPPEQFVASVLVRGMGVKYVVIGDDFRFGNGRGGDFAMLQKAGLEQGFGVEAMHTVEVREERASSSAVRDALLAGNLEHAADLLGRAYCIAGRVIHGDKIGRQLGYHTANIALKRRRVPLEGVYTVTVTGQGLGDGKTEWPGVASVGTRPTVDGRGKMVLEVHLFDFDGELYQAHLTVNFLHKLRDQVKFNGLDALREAIGRDVAEAKGYFEKLESQNLTAKAQRR